jgi:hypothetical protein
MKRIYTEIQELYPDNLVKQLELKNDFCNWIKGKYGIPKTKEIREHILKYEGGK